MTNRNNWNLLNVCVCPHRALALAHKCLLKLVNLVQLLVALYVVAVFVVAVVLASGAMQMVIFIASMCPCLHSTSSSKAQAFGASMATLCAHWWLTVPKLLLLFAALNYNYRFGQSVSCATVCLLTIASCQWQVASTLIQ